jgi:hypothetical protein
MLPPFVDCPSNKDHQRNKSDGIEQLVEIYIDLRRGNLGEKAPCTPDGDGDQRPEKPWGGD